MEKESSKARSGFAAFLDNYFYKKESTFFRTRQIVKSLYEYQALLKHFIVSKSDS